MGRLRWGLLIMMVVLLAGCRSNMSEGDAEKGIRAMLEEDFETAQDYVCEAEIENLRTVTESDSFDGLNSEVDCQRFSDQMMCEVTFVDRSAQEAATLELRYEIQDGKLCERIK